MCWVLMRDASLQTWWHQRSPCLLVSLLFYSASVTLHDVTLHDVTLCYITLCYIKVHYVTVCYITLCYIMLCYIMLHYIKVHKVTVCYIVLHYVSLWLSALAAGFLLLSLSGEKSIHTQPQLKHSTIIHTQNILCHQSLKSNAMKHRRKKVYQNLVITQQRIQMSWKYLIHQRSWWVFVQVINMKSSISFHLFYKINYWSVLGHLLSLKTNTTSLLIIL